MAKQSGSKGRPRGRRAAAGARAGAAGRKRAGSPGRKAGARARAELAAVYATGVGPTPPARAAAGLAMAGAAAPARPRPGRALALAVAAPPALSASQGRPPADAPVEPELDVDDIQGNALVGFNKDFQAFLFFRITDVAMARRWLRDLTPRVATAADTLAFRRLFRAMRARAGSEPQGMVATWINIAFANTGIRQLTSEADLAAFTDLAFQVGMADRAGDLGDPVDAQTNPTGWKVGAGEKYPDVLLIVASDRRDVLRDEVSRLLQE